MTSPTIGRIVMFHLPLDIHGRQILHNGAHIVPAIVGQVFPGAPYANLFVMPPFAPPYWEGSVEEGDGPRHWTWPEIVRA